CINCQNTGYSDFATGYQSAISKSCNIETLACTSTTVYRCASGYYGSSTTGTSGCTQCPTGGTSDAGATDATDCYASPRNGTDTTGSWEYTSTCYYSTT
ncbi:MAG: hypothetical protein LBF28_01665, partial [Rickettsiales bacterium]|nr:hypothetical protein [Rickettsiales bacterium]